MEQAAVSPANLLPGIGFSPDKMLQARLFSYGDTQRHRLGVNLRQSASANPFSLIANHQHAFAADRHNVVPIAILPLVHGTTEAAPHAAFWEAVTSNAINPPAQPPSCPDDVCSGYGCTGVKNLKIAPRGSFASTHNRPPCASMIERQIDRPIPKPVGLVV